MNRSALLVVLLAGGIAAADKGDASNVIQRQLTALRTAAKCADKSSPWRPWCIGAEFDKGTAGELPKGKVLVGVKVRLEEGKDAAAALTERVTMAALAIDADGKLKLIVIEPQNDSETKMIAEAVFNISAVLKGKSKVAKLPKDLAGFAKTVKGAYAATKTPAGWTWTGTVATELRKVGAFWVAVEVPDSGISVAVFTEAWQ